MDQYWNDRGLGGDNFAVVVSPQSSTQRAVHATLNDNADASYSADFIATFAGVSTVQSILLSGQCRGTGSR